MTTGTRARVRQGSLYGKVGVEYEVLQFTGDAEWVLRDPDNDVIVFEDDRGYVEVRCASCGRWSQHVLPALHGDDWLCADGHDGEGHDGD